MEDIVYAEKSLELATEHPVYFAALLLLDAVHGRVLAAGDFLTKRLTKA